MDEDDEDEDYDYDYEDEEQQPQGEATFVLTNTHKKLFFEDLEDLGGFLLLQGQQRGSERRSKLAEDIFNRKPDIYGSSREPVKRKAFVNLASRWKKKSYDDYIQELAYLGVNIQAPLKGRKGSSPVPRLSSPPLLLPSPPTPPRHAPPQGRVVHFHTPPPQMSQSIRSMPRDVREAYLAKKYCKILASVGFVTLKMERLVLTL
jgi:hypothetical protein